MLSRKSDPLTHNPAYSYVVYYARIYEGDDFQVHMETYK